MRRRVVLLATVLAGCARPPAPAQELTGSAEELARLLDRLAILSGTPIGQQALAARPKLEGCPSFVLPFDPATGALGPLACGAERRIGLELSLALSDGTALTGRGEVSPGGDLRADLTVVPGDRAAGLGLLMPAGAPAGPHRLNLAEAVLFGRLRTNSGLNLARLVAAGGQLDRQFGLKAQLFSGAVLDTAFELAMYAPRPGEAVPRTALALDVRSRALAVEALEAFLDQLAKQWPIRRSPARFGEHEGVCLDNLEILPGLAPCYLATEDAILIGWNSDSLLHAAAAGPRPVETAAGRIVVELARLPSVDLELSRARYGERALAKTSYPWSRLELRLSRPADPRVEITLDGPVAPAVAP